MREREFPLFKNILSRREVPQIKLYRGRHTPVLLKGTPLQDGLPHICRALLYGNAFFFSKSLNPTTTTPKNKTKQTTAKKQQKNGQSVENNQKWNQKMCT